MSTVVGLRLRWRTSAAPDVALFEMLAAKPYEHCTWSVRANWLLADALGVAGPSRSSAFPVHETKFGRN
jgi:hypothetical protein